MAGTTQSNENQTPVNSYVLRAVSRVIVPKGIDEVEIFVGRESVKVKSSRDEGSEQEQQAPHDAVVNEEQ
jgi:hypothetical protein